jgi:hypothetical protein
MTEVIANSVQFLDRKAGGPAHEQGTSKGEMESFGSPVAFDEEIPF